MNPLKYSFRSLVKTPLVSAIAILSLALGIGANAAIFSIFESMLLRSLPVQEPQSLVNLCATGPSSGWISNGTAGECVFSYPMFRDLEAVPEVFDGVAAYREFGANLAFKGATLSAEGSTVSGSYFPTLGLHPALGRLFDSRDDTTPGAHPIVVLSHAYWTNSLAQDPSVLNQALTVNGVPLLIVGVAPQGFRGPTLGEEPDIFIPLSMREALVPGFPDLENRKGYWAYLFARLAPGVSLERAQLAANQRYRQIIQDVELPLQTSTSENYLARFAEKTLELTPGKRGQSSLMKDSKTPLLLLLGVTGFVLLIACANVANLLLTKATERSGEIALRMSLGARRRQVVTQLLSESLLLSAFGGALGLVVAMITLETFEALLPSNSGALIALELGPVAWLFLLVLTLVTSLVGLVPALKVSRPDLAHAMRAQSSKVSGTRAVIRFRMALATIQIAMSLALLVAAGLFAKSLLNVSKVDLGIEVDRLATFGVSPELNGYKPTDSRSLFIRLENEIAALPGVTGVAGSMVPIIAGSNWGTNVTVEGFEAEPDADTNSRYNEVSPAFFSALGIPLISGRVFTENDVEGSPKVAIVNETFAKKFGLDREAVGRRMQMGSRGENDIEIVGLVKDSKYSEVKGETPPLFFLPYRQDDALGSLNYYVRTEGDPAALQETLRATVNRADPSLPVEELRTLETQVRENVFLDTLLSRLSAAFALLATILAAVGLYGTLAYSVSKRSGEIGLRMALGADSARVQRMILKQVGLLTAVGAGLGLVAAIAIGRAAGSLLYELDGWDPTVLVGSSVFLLLIALLAGGVPARRASRIDPMVALRDE